MVGVKDITKIMNGEKKRRQQRRSLAIELIIDSIRHLPEVGQKVAETKILEFGSGDGFQISYLQTLGHVIASDIYVSENMKANHQSSFVQCDICAAPFRSNTFDLIFSNHVIEHVEDLNLAFRELKRIGKTDCIYAFSVPTALWLVISIPAYYYNILAWMLGKLFKHVTSDIASLASTREERRLTANENTRRTKKQFMMKILKSILPGGHGRYMGFFNCWRHFRVKEWRDLFQNNGFEVLGVEPLLLYAAAELPVLPAIRLPARFGWCSSILFLMRRVAEK
jgi:SAM-dependent methyltransferase